MGFLKNIFRRFRKADPEVQTPTPVPDESTVFRLRSEISSLNMTISELQQVIENQKIMLDEAFFNKNRIIAESVEARVNSLLADIVSPLAQFNLLQSLAKEGKVIQQENIFKLIGILESRLEDIGLKQIHTLNEQYLFDPETMHPMKPDLNLTQDEKVLVRLPGYIYKEKVISKSLIDKVK